MKIWRNYSAIAKDGGSWTVDRFFSVSICCIGVIRVPLLQRVSSFCEHLLHRRYPRSAVVAGEFFP
jgi:hypothetical protein